MRALILLLSCCSLLWCGLVRAEVSVRGVRLWAPPEYTRAVLDVSGTTEYKLFVLRNPDRLVLDLKNARSKAGAMPEARGLIKGVRVGSPEAGTLRVVFDLAAAVRPKSFLLNPADRFSHRLVLDLYPQDPVSSDKPRVVKSIASITEGRRKVVIAIDAGHGGDDPGAIGAAGTYEKNVTLKIAKALAKKINSEDGMEAVLVRDGDYYIEHGARFEKARIARADLFISIHADAFTSPNVTGSGVYILGARAASNEAARYLADRENRSDLVGGVSVKDKDDTLAAVLLDLSQGATLEASSRAAEHVLGSLKAMGKTHKRYVERANFYVLRSPDVPSMLVETAFISNSDEEKKLNDPTHRNKLAAAILAGVREYFYSSPPPGTWIAANSAARGRSHIVASGETLSEIAARHQVTISALRRENNLRTDMVRVGVVLRIPGSG